MEKFTRYEKARMIGARALQISMGAPFLIKLDEKKLEELKYNPVEIAKLEFEEGVIPLEILRKHPEFIEDKGRHPMAVKSEGAAEITEGEELKIQEEDEEEMEASEGGSAEEVVD
ncbi:DNA-directed RNA polymerase subunit K [Candidatus Woesearchaeota archaeon]|nr:DNA-directed RNA polymerase subunit K [Candidatus Woesearchaeota archaeon]